MTNLRRLYRGLEALYGAATGIDPHDHVLAVESQNDTGPRELLLVREEHDAIEVGLALDEQVLATFEGRHAHETLDDDALADTLPVLEGLSHLLYVAEAARRERPVSGLELETQAEVDKLAVCVLHRWPHARGEFGRLVDRLYHRFHLAPHVDENLARRYHTANRVALSFAKTLWPHVDAGRIGELRRSLRRFWHAPMGKKRSLAA